MNSLANYASPSQGNFHESRRTFASNIREIQQADGSIVKEYFFENPRVSKKAPTTPIVTSSEDDETSTSQNQYEVTDEFGNVVPLNGIDKIIQMSGIEPRQIQQPDGTIIKEYVIDDPRPATVKNFPPLPPPPPPPRKQSKKINIEHLSQIFPQQLYEYFTRTGRRIEFLIDEISNDVFRLPENDPTLITAAPTTGIDPNAFETGQFPPIFTEPLIDWSILRQQDPQGEIDPQLVRQFIQQRYEKDNAELSAQFLPDQEKTNSRHFFSANLREKSINNR